MIHKEITFIDGINELKKKYGDKTFYDWYWTPNKYKNGLPIVKCNLKNNSLFLNDVCKLQKKLDFPPIYDDDKIDNYLLKINKIIKNINYKFDKKITKEEKDKQMYALYRYYVIGALNNISLSVSPKLKKIWKINFELFGSFYNTNSDYCGLFSDIEKSSCDFNTFKLKKNQIILINPPYTEYWLITSCNVIESIMKKNMNTKIYFVIPIWNISDRKKLNLSINRDLPEIDELKKSTYLKKHEIINIEFYNGIIKQEIKLKDKVHLFIFDNYQK